jgi:hypothetical protein
MTITLLITPKGSTIAKRYVCTVDAKNTIPGRLSDGTDFPTPGGASTRPASLVTALPNLGSRGDESITGQRLPPRFRRPLNVQGPMAQATSLES